VLKVFRNSSIFYNEEDSSPSYLEESGTIKDIVACLGTSYKKPWSVGFGNRVKSAYRQSHIIPFHMHIELLNYASLIRISLQAEAGYFQEDITEERSSPLLELMERLTLMRTQIN
jgi:hypothetical protein